MAKKAVKEEAKQIVCGGCGETCNLEIGISKRHTLPADGNMVEALESDDLVYVLHKIYCPNCCENVIDDVSLEEIRSHLRATPDSAWLVDILRLADTDAKIYWVQG
jgi:hypothetical protein